MPPELTTVANDEIVWWDGPAISRQEGLEPGTEHRVGDLTARTLDRPPGERLSTFATINDVHFGETVCGHVEGLALDGLQAEAGDDPYPLVMNRAAATEIAAVVPDAVVAKGDLTCAGRAEEFDQFLSVYGDLPLTWVRGNHDRPEVPAPPAVQAVDLAGVTLVVLDTSRPGLVGGQIDADQAEGLDELAGRTDRPMVVMGHHPPWSERLQIVFGAAEGSGLDQPSVDRLAAVINRRPSIVAYLAGHTHRNKLRHLPATGAFPWVEVACVKDFPGSWAEYRVFEGGILQVHRRVSADPAAVAWSERCRTLYAGLYPQFALGRVEDRCFEIPLREPTR